MIIFVSSIFYTIQLFIHHSNCLNLIDLQQGRVAHSPKWKLQSRRAPLIYETPFPRKRVVTSNFRKFWHRNVRPHKKIFFQPSRRIRPSRRLYEDERDANLKNKISSLMQQTMHSTDEMMKEVEVLKQQYREERPYKAGFVLSMLKKSREVVNELFNVAIKHRDEWQALEQLKIFEIIVHTNVDTSHLLKQLIDLHGGLDVVLDYPGTTNATTPATNLTTDDEGSGVEPIDAGTKDITEVTTVVTVTDLTNATEALTKDINEVTTLVTVTDLANATEASTKDPNQATTTNLTTDTSPKEIIEAT